MWTMLKIGTTFLLQPVKNKVLYFLLPQFSQKFGTMNTAMMNNHFEFLLNCNKFLFVQKIFFYNCLDMLRNL